MNMNLELLLAEAEESSSGIDLLLPATSELVAGIAAFAIVFFFIWKWALPALNETLESRASAIEGQIKEAEETKAEAEKSKAEYDKLVSNADSEVQTIIDEGKAAAEKIKEDMLAEAKKEAEAIVEKAKSDYEYVLNKIQRIQNSYDKKALDKNVITKLISSNNFENKVNNLQISSTDKLIYVTFTTSNINDAVSVTEKLMNGSLNQIRNIRYQQSDKQINTQLIFN